MSNGDIRPEDYASFKRMSEQGKLRLIPAGVALDANLLWFNLSPAAARDPRNAWLRHKDFRRALSCAVDRQAIVNSVYLGEAVPIHGPDDARRIAHGMWPLRTRATPIPIARANSSRRWGSATVTGMACSKTRRGSPPASRF